MTPADPLSLDRLRDLHPPGGTTGIVQGEIAAALLAGFLAALLVGLARALLGRIRAGPRRAALAALAESRNLGADERLLAQARLLRRLVRTLGGDAEAAARGPEWAARLDALFRTDVFTSGTGRAVTDGLYRRRTADPAVLDAELSRLIKRLRP